jgi:hypothetical protein
LDDHFFILYLILINIFINIYNNNDENYLYFFIFYDFCNWYYIDNVFKFIKLIDIGIKSTLESKLKNENKNEK